MNIAVCFLSTLLGHFNLKDLQKQAKESKLHNVVIYEYIDDKSEYKINENIVYFCYDDLKRKFNYNHYYYNGIGGSQNTSGSQFLPLLDMYTNHIGEYDAYMFYEDDLSYFGTENLFDRINFNYDVIFQSPRDYVDKQKWWWDYNTPNKLDKSYIKYFGLLNIYIFKDGILNGLIEFIKSNYHHHECLLSSYVLNNNYTVGYIDSYIKSFFTYMNCIDDKNFNEYCIYELLHPIKSKHIHDEIKKLKEKY